MTIEGDVLTVPEKYINNLMIVANPITGNKELTIKGEIVAEYRHKSNR